MINKDKTNRVRPMADSKKKKFSPMTFNYFRYDGRKKNLKKCCSRSFSVGTSDKILQYIILFLVATAHSAGEKC